MGEHLKPKTFNFYCDESCHLENDGKPFMIISYVSTAYNQLELHNKAIRALKAKHNFYAEIKWNKVSRSKFAFYSDLIEYFFATDLQFRAIVINKNNTTKRTYEKRYDDLYYEMYYRLLHHKINMEYNYNVYMDIKDTRSAAKIKKLKDILNIEYSSIRNLQNVKSKESELLQLSDLLMGAISYRMSDQNKVLAKNRIIEKILSHAQVIFPNNLSKNHQKLNLFFIELQ